MRGAIATVSFALIVAYLQCTSALASSKYSLGAHRLTKGFVEGRIYKNASLGLELTLAPGLNWGSPEINGTPGTVPLVIKVAAYGERKLFSATRGTVFYSDTLAYYPAAQRSTEAYLGKVIRANRQDGFELVAYPSEDRWNGVSLARADFRKREVYEVVLVKACQTQAYVFIFAGSGRIEANQLISETKLKFDLAKSGCSANISRDQLR